MDGKRWLFLIAFFLPITASAAVVEMSFLAGYGRSEFKVNGGHYKALQRKYSGSIDLKFTQVSSLQVEYSDTMNRISSPTNVGVVVTQYTTETITYQDKIYSFNWVQNLVPSKWLIQPYIKFGGGRINRRQTLEYPEYGEKYTVTQKIVTGVGGVGLRIFLTKSLALKGELNTYVPDFKFSVWKQNQMFTSGLSWLF